MASGVTISWICTGGALVETGVVPGVPGTSPPGIGIPVPGLIAGAPGIPPPGIIPGTPPGTALVGAIPGTPPGTIPGTAGIVPTPPGTAPGTMVGGVLVAMPGTALVAPGIPGIAGTPAHAPCSKERNAVLQNRVFFMSGLSLACCNHRPFQTNHKMAVFQVKTALFPRNLAVCLPVPAICRWRINAGRL